MPNVIKPFQDQTALFKTLAHPTRLAILDILRDGEQCVCHMEAMLKSRQAHISQHLMVLREAGLVEDRRDGWNIYYRVAKPEIYAVLDSVNAITGIPLPIVHLHAAEDCPCPKCHTGMEA
jgi:DNA-binding transcriptional ArsR family regulator